MEYMEWNGRQWPFLWNAEIFSVLLCARISIQGFVCRFGPFMKNVNLGFLRTFAQSPHYSYHHLNINLWIIRVRTFEAVQIIHTCPTTDIYILYRWSGGAVVSHPNLRYSLSHSTRPLAAANKKVNPFGQTFGEDGTIIKSKYVLIVFSHLILAVCNCPQRCLFIGSLVRGLKNRQLWWTQRHVVYSQN